MSNTSNKIRKSSETYSRKTLAEQEEAFWLLGELQQELAREQEGRHAEQGIASEAYKYVAGENDLALTVKATVKPGRYPENLRASGDRMSEESTISRRSWPSPRAAAAGPLRNPRVPATGESSA